MRPHAALTVVSVVPPESEDEVARTLDEMGADPGGNAVLPFGKLTGVHFARIVLLPPAVAPDGDVIGARLVLMSDADGGFDQHLGDLADAAGDGLDRLFGPCDGYPKGRTITHDDRVRYLRDHSVRNAAVYVNTVGRTVTEVREDARLRDALQELLDRHRERWSTAPPDEVHAELQAEVGRDPSLSWALRPRRTRRPLGQRLRDAAHLVSVPAAGIVLAPVLAIVAPFYAFVLRRHERRDASPRYRPEPERVARLSAAEDLIAHNQFSAVGFVKPGPFRRFTITVAMALLDWGNRHLFPRGNLAGVRTIHFARWVFLDGKRRVFFASNYDGSLESYMDDFIDKVAWGLNLVFSNGVGYPRTSWLVRGGARDEEAFKAYLRYHQLPTQVWYSAYPDLTARNIANNAHIRAGLPWSRPSVSRTRAWLARL